MELLILAAAFGLFVILPMGMVVHLCYTAIPSGDRTNLRADYERDSYDTIIEWSVYMVAILIYIVMWFATWPFRND